METTDTTTENTSTPEMSENVRQNQTMSENVRLLTPRQRSAAQLLNEGKTVRYTAKHLEIREETVTRWKRLPVFAAEMLRLSEADKKNAEDAKRARIHVLEEVRTNMQHEVTHLMNEAIRTVTGQLNNLYDNSSDRAKLALDVLKFLKTDQLAAPKAEHNAAT